ncbi:hypothetical protein J1781_09245 [Rahnella sp. C60]|uniref:hypothetical protein n=1 Tax=Rahnella perminowiae TaxID=2816244 RepID=UPI001C26D2D4|nr:hypothetical protein [Rahnella perminowiae]MBU9808390.1 hypothetical protein [Rahnella perminowiae]MBU9815034.1 hypothetical protein [Rahnella perminowiae]MCX2946691.1 hypothetical protein [Rahnella perminowiae]
MAALPKMVTLTAKMVRKGHRELYAPMAATAGMAATHVTETQMAEAVRPVQMELTDE